MYVLMIIKSVHYAPNFEEVEGAYWFGPVRLCVRGALRFAYGQELLEIGFWKLIYWIYMKK